MGSLIKGTHHISMKCTDTGMYQRAFQFYHDILGLEVVRTWGEGAAAGAMLDAGGVIIELFASGMTAGKTGSINHFALSTDDVDACIEKVRKAGYDITVEPQDIVIGSQPPYPVRIAFCVGAAGEEIEIFCEK